MTKVKSIDETEEVELDKWIVDERTGEKSMYTRVQDIQFCTDHTFNSAHECVKCPYVFVGFRSNLHIQKDNGIYERRTLKKII